MNKYQKFLMEARLKSNKTGGVKSPGFGAPLRAKPKKLSKEELIRWHSKSEKEQKTYLEKYPNSKFKNAPKKANDTKIITRSKKISRSPTAIALTQKSMDTIKSWGVKNTKITKERAHKMITSAKQFLKGNRDKFVEKATGLFNKFKGKLSKADQGEADREAEQIVKSGVKPSRTYSLKERTSAGFKAVLPSLIGVACVAAIFGGFIPPEAIAFIGVKILDSAWDVVKHVTHESGGLSALVAGAVIKDYMKSKDSDEDIKNTTDKLEKAHGSPEEPDEQDDSNNTEESDGKTSSNDEETKVEPEKPKNDSVKFKDSSTLKMDPDKYEQDSDGNWKRKK